MNGNVQKKEVRNGILTGILCNASLLEQRASAGDSSLRSGLNRITQAAHRAADLTTQDLLESVARYALCGRAPVLRELGIEPSTVNGPVRVRIEPISTSRHENLPLVFEAPCSPRDSQ